MPIQERLYVATVAGETRILAPPLYPSPVPPPYLRPVPPPLLTPYLPPVPPPYPPPYLPPITPNRTPRIPPVTGARRGRHTASFAQRGG